MDSTKHEVVPIVVIVGETASGKTAAAIELAKRVSGEIICADSRTVYKHMNIGTAKPSQLEQYQVRHHLIDVVEPNESFSAAQFQELAQKCIQEIYGRGKVPIIVGGTGLYIDSILFNYTFTSKADTQFRNNLEQMGDDKLTTIMNTKNIDTSSLNTKNRRHVIRAIERDGAVPKNTKLRQNTFVAGLRLDRDVLKQRISLRVDQMFNDGFLDEVASLANRFGWDNESMSGIGYRVAREYFHGSTSVDSVKTAFIQRDLSLAKRQRTWFKRNRHIHWYSSPGRLIDEAVAFLNA